MINDRSVETLAIGALCESLAQLTREPFGRGKYRGLVYSALLSANTIGYNTGVALVKTDGDASVVDAVIALPTDVVKFRLPWFIGSLAGGSPELETRAITEYLSQSVHGTLPFQRDPNRCCTRCHVWETKEGSYCHNTRCHCHKRR